MKGFTGISFPFRFNARGGVATSTTRDGHYAHIEESIQQIIRTHKYERVMEVGVGTDWSEVLHEAPNAITSSTLEFEITKALDEQEPRIKVTDVFVDYIDDETQGSALVCTISYVVLNYASNHTTTLNL